MTQFLEGVPEVSEVTKPTPNSYRVKLPRVEKALPTIVEGVSDYGLKITDISFTKPTLEQVFLEVTGDLSGTQRKALALTCGSTEELKWVCLSEIQLLLLKGR